MSAFDILREHLGRLEARDQDFARSLLSACNPSESQLHWIGILADMARPRPTYRIVGADRIVRLLTSAKQHIKRPGISLMAHNLRIELDFSVPAASPRPFSGCLVVTNEFGRSLRNRHYFGRVVEGRFDPVTDLAPGIAEVLNKLGADPVTFAREQAKNTGYCIFCSRQLTDPRSTEVGYGPVCALEWGLPWAKTSKAE